MLFCHLGQAKSLREITEGLQASEGKLRHLGLSEAPGHPTLTYANARRPREIYQDLFQYLLPHLQGQLGLQGKSARQFSWQTAQPGLDGHRSVCPDVRLGRVQKDQGRGEDPFAAGSRWLSAAVRRHYRRQDE
jgi:hypothetical protein